jgi:hypothetical protein
MAGAVAGWRGDRARPPERNPRKRAPLRAGGRAIAEAWRDGERFYDLVVIASVGLFFVLAIGVGIIALQLR